MISANTLGRIQVASSHEAEAARVSGCLRGELVTFAVVIARRPVSGQKGPNHSYKKAIREAAQGRIGRPFTAGSLYARIVWLHRPRREQDVDNILKPILDALKGVVYDDDKRVTQCLAAAIDRSAEVVLSDSRVSDRGYDELVAAIAEDENHILYIEVGEVMGNRVVFGPIDGGGRS